MKLTQLYYVNKISCVPYYSLDNAAKFQPIGYEEVSCVKINDELYQRKIEGKFQCDAILLTPTANEFKCLVQRI